MSTGRKRSKDVIILKRNTRYKVILTSAAAGNNVHLKNNMEERKLI